MSKKNNQNVENVDVENVENVDVEVVDMNTGQEDQPVPNTTNYDVTVDTTDKFVNEVISSLGEFSYAETNNLLSFIQQSRTNVPINIMNDVLSRIASFPWKAVNGVMSNIATHQDEYFIINNK